MRSALVELDEFAPQSFGVRLDLVGAIAFRAMDALAITVAALGGGVVATILNEWLRGRREYEEARLLVMAELAFAVSLKTWRRGELSAAFTQRSTSFAPTRQWVT